MKWYYSVSFESDKMPVRTYSGTVEGGAGPASRRAVVKARKQHLGRLVYRSVVIVLQKIGPNESEEAEVSGQPIKVVE